MRQIVITVLFSVLWAGAFLGAQTAPDGTPERAIQDLALATTPQEVERHLPVSTLDAAKTLQGEDRRAFEEGLLWRQSPMADSARFAVPEDGRAFLVVNSGENASEIQLTDSVVTGLDAVLRFAIQGAGPVPMDALVWMRFEEGEWRIRELNTGFGNRIRFDDAEFVERFRNREQKENESSAIETLYSVRYAVHRYSETFPEIGIPEDLSALAEPILSDDGGDSMSFLQAELAHNHFRRGGYQFCYQVLLGGPEGRFAITARPARFGESGRASYLLDESGQIHQTTEDREATMDDPS